MLYRYECDGIGIFHILNKLEDAMEKHAEKPDQEELERVEYELNSRLLCPEIPRGIKTESWFTEYGFRHLQEYLDVIKYHVERYLGSSFMVNIRVLENFPPRRIVYQDDHQVVFASGRKNVSL